jgi:hypothetical protein
MLGNTFESVVRVAGAVASVVEITGMTETSGHAGSGSGGGDREGESHGAIRGGECDCE